MSLLSCYSLTTLFWHLTSLIWICSSGRWKKEVLQVLRYWASCYGNQWNCQESLFLSALLMRLLQSCRAPNCGWDTKRRKSRAHTPQAHCADRTLLCFERAPCCDRCICNVAQNSGFFRFFSCLALQVERGGERECGDMSSVGSSMEFSTVLLYSRSHPGKC